MLRRHRKCVKDFWYIIDEYKNVRAKYKYVLIKDNDAKIEETDRKTLEDCTYQLSGLIIRTGSFMFPELATKMSIMQERIINYMSRFANTGIEQISEDNL